MAPVLKTGRLKGLVGSNPTPSVLIFDWRLPIADFRQHDSPNEKRAQNPQNSRADYIGEIMRADVDPREADQDRNRETGNPDPPVCKNKDGEERSRGGSVT